MIWHFLPQMADCEGAWRNYRRRRNQFVFVFVGYVPICFAFAYLTTKLFHTTVPGLTFGICWMVLFAVTGLRLQVLPCPRCGEAFFAKWFYHNIFARRCVHCGLPKYSDSRSSINGR